MHCKDVSVREVGFPLAEESIKTSMAGWKAYTRTEYVVLRNGGTAVVRLAKDDRPSLFRKVDAVEVVSLPESTVYVEDPDIDVLNLPALAALQARYPGKTVVVKGLFSHVSIVSGLAPLRLRVIDSVPPEPSKLGHLVRTALASGYVDLPIVPEDMVIDMAAEVPPGDCPVMFPCAVSGSVAPGRETLFLDQAPSVDGEVALVGCHLSRSIFESIYRRKPDHFRNVCPPDRHPDDGVKTIAKCCKIKGGHKIDGDMAVVPWGATVPEVVDAINAMFSE
ncbi:MAG: hypothetical protein GX224_04685 [Thermoplasmatales archaeon]|nr:hypothetical protein [Thermoplasmatales archaeon]